MGYLPESGAAYPAGVYQIEQTDPVLGGAPNEATGAGLSNIPALQLANRTAWLKAALSTLTGRRVNASGLASGGGALSSDVTINVPVAAQADAEAGTNDALAMTPLKVRQAIAKLALSLAGGTMTGALTLAGDPVSALQAATKQYIDNLIGGRVSRGGDSMSGPLSLPGNPVAALQAAPKQYVDKAVAGALASNAASLVQNGYAKWPSGLIMQWGVADLSGTLQLTVPFNIAFPSACVMVNTTPIFGSPIAGDKNDYAFVASVGLGSFLCTRGYDYGYQVYWQALGF